MITPPTQPLADLPVHEGIEEWMVAALTGGLSSAEERRQFEDHLAGCPGCRELFAEETAMSHTLEEVFTAARPSLGFENRLVSAFRRRHSAGLGARWRALMERPVLWPVIRVVGGAAAVAALVGLGGVLTGEIQSSRPTRSQVVEPAAELALNDRLGDPVAPVAAPATPAAHAFGFGGKDDGQISTATRRIGGGAAGASVDGSLAANLAPEGRDKREPFSRDRLVNREASGSAAPDFAFVARDGQNALASTAVRRLESAEKDKKAGETESSKQNLNFFASNAPAEKAGLAEPASQAQSPVPPSAAEPSPATLLDTRKLIRNANVDLEVAAFEPALDALGGAATQAGGGYVATVNSSRLPNGKRRGSVVIKVLPDHLDAFLARLRELGEVKGQTVSAEDVTKAYFDTDARLRNARRMEDRLLKLLDEAKGKLAEVLQVEKELGRVREDIEKMQGELQLYDSLVRYATVTINLYEKDLQQPAAFLLRQTAELALLAADVERTYADARRVAESAHAQIVTSDLVHAPDGRVSATLRLLFEPPAADGAIAQLKTLGRVQNFNLRDERIAQNGSDAPAASAPGVAKLERGPVTVDLSINHDEETHRRINAAVFAGDPSSVFEKLRAAGIAAGGEIVNSTFTRTHGVHGTGALAVRIPAGKEGPLLEVMRTLGRVGDFNDQRDDNAAVDAAPILLTLNIADEPAHRRISLTLIAPDLDAAFDKVRAAALAAGGEITNSRFNRSQDAHGDATIEFLVPGKSEPSVLEAVRALGRGVNFNVQRDGGAPDENSDRAPVDVTINFADEEPPAQQTSVAVECTGVTERQADLRKIAADAGAQVRSSTFEQGADGRETATLVLRMPLAAYPGFMSRLPSLGEVKDLNVHRQDRPEAATNATAPAEISLRLYSQGRLVSDDSGLIATIRRTLAEGASALTWSLRMIGVALAFLAPWLAGVALIVWVGRLVSRRKQKAAEPAKKD